MTWGVRLDPLFGSVGGAQARPFVELAETCGFNQAGHSQANRLFKKVSRDHRPHPKRNETENRDFKKGQGFARECCGSERSRALVAIMAETAGETVALLHDGVIDGVLVQCFLLVNQRDGFFRWHLRRL
eukprot:3981082-Amphidinium_carterae.1